MSEFINIDEEDGETIMRNMETALGFPGWNLLGAKYDNRFKNISALFSHEEDTNVHSFSFRVRDGKLTAYTHLQFPPEIFIRYFDYQKNGYVLTSHEAKLKNVFDRVMTPELALKMVEAGVLFERAAKSVQ